MSDDEQQEPHLHVVPLTTSTEAARRDCVLILRELLARAEQGEFVQLAVVLVRADTTYHMRWTKVVDEVRIIGLLEAVKAILISRLRFSKDR